MTNSNGSAGGGRQKPTATAGSPQLSPEHYLRLIFHRKWLVLGTFVLVTAITVVVVNRMPDSFNSETLILVDPQKVPESYVRATVTGDVRNRLGTLSQQILSATRLQKIIDSLNLYPEERKKQVAREDIITRMRANISVGVVNDFGAGQDLQAFRIGFSGTEPRKVAQVANELASLFIDENLKAREQQATGTNEFLQNRLQDTRKTLEQHESKLRDYRLRHIGEMPEQQTADLQILGQLQSQLQAESEALARANQQKNYYQTMMGQTSAGVVDLDPAEPPRPQGPAQAEAKSPTRAASALTTLRARLAGLQARYHDQHPDVRKLKQQIVDEEARERAREAAVASVEVKEPMVAGKEPAPVAPPVRATQSAALRSSNPVLQSQLRAVEDEIVKHVQEQARINKRISSYQGKLEAIPVREQEISSLVRDYEISKLHYQQLLDKQLSAETATQLEIRQKGEKFSVLDPAQPAERPSKPNRRLINLAGAMGGLALGLFLALVTEFLGLSITDPEQLVEIAGVPMLEVIPVIVTNIDRKLRRKRLFVAAASGVAVVLMACGAVLIYHNRA